MALHPLQGPLDNLVDYLADARRLHDVATILREQQSTERRNNGQATGAGSPTVHHKSLNRAVVVASVGAMEAFFEDLALTAVDLTPGLAQPEDWFHIETKGSRAGMIQTPSPYNVRKMLWVFFRYDPRSDWDITVSVSPAETTSGHGSTWRGALQQVAGPDAAKFLHAMVKVRHGFAHQDHAQKPPHEPGIVNLTPKGKVAVHSHHAENSMSALVQVAIQSAHGLSNELDLAGTFRWSKKMDEADWEWLLKGTQAASLVASHWRGHPF